MLAADGHTLIHFGLSMLIKNESDLTLIGEAKNIAEAKSLAYQLSPDVLLIELAIIEHGIAESILELRNICPLCKILIYTGNNDPDAHILALRAGAKGILTKNLGNNILLKAIRGVFSGELWIDRSLTAKLLGNSNLPEITASVLTPRESEIARLSAKGLSSRKIAERLYINEKTVRNQLTIIYHKLGVCSQIDLILLAPSIGL